MKPCGKRTKSHLILVVSNIIKGQFGLKKDAGEKVTLIPDLARGMTADAKFQRDLADVRFTAGREALDAIKTQVSSLQTILKYQTEV